MPSMINHMWRNHQALKAFRKEWLSATDQAGRDTAVTNYSAALAAARAKAN